MNDCWDIKRLISAFLDGEIAPTDRARVEDHLKTCADCARELASLAQGGRILKGLARVPAPEDFLAKVHARLERPNLRERISRIFPAPLWLKIPLEAAAVAATVLLVYALVYQQPSPYRSPAAPASKLGLMREEKAKAADAVAPRSVAESEDAGKAFGYAAAPPPRLRLSLQSVPAENLIARANQKSAAEAEKVVARSVAVTGLATTAEEPAAGTMPAAGMAPAENIPAALSSEKDAIRRIADAVCELGGKEIAKEVIPAGKPRSSLEVEIPASRYPDLLRTLRGLGEVEKPYPPSPPSDQGILRLRIEILPQR